VKGGRTKLERLFDPAPGAGAKVYRWFASGLLTDARHAFPTAATIAHVRGWTIGAIVQFPIAALVGAALAVAMGGATIQAVDALFLKPIAWALALGLAVLLPLLAFVVAIGWRLQRALKDNGFGLVSGRGPENLTEWLHEQLQSLAGKPLDQPLTFGDLWGAPLGAAPLGETEERSVAQTQSHRRGIDLRLMTTCVSLGRGYSFPLEPSEKLYFNADELRNVLPESVVAWLVNHERPAANANAAAFEKRLSDEKLIRLPVMANLPILLAVRMSLAFPVLLSAVPLWRAVWVNGDVAKFERLWFSDGGIISNFPIHYFDTALPTRPTFGINLEEIGFGERKSPLELRTELRPPALELLAPRLDAERSLGGFLGALIGTLHGWNDRAQLTVPGYADRVVTVRLKPGEGGMNLKMQPDLIRVIAQRGAAAGQQLVDAFADLQAVPSEAWRNHRWVRFRTTSALLENALIGLVAQEDASANGKTSIQSLHKSQSRFQMSADQTEQSFEFYRRLVDLGRWLAKASAALKWSRVNGPNPSGNHGPPKPASELRIRPRM
jgi:hypothetical protein